MLENVAAVCDEFELRALGRSAVSGETAARATELLEFVGLGDYVGARATDLSYGQRKLVELAQVLMLDPAVILLDEPAAGINPSLVQRLAELIRALNAAGKTFLIVEHDMQFVLSLCDPVIVLSRGAVIASGRAGGGQRRPGRARGLPRRGLRARGDRGAAMIALRSIVAGYGGGDVLQGVDLDVPRGSITCIVGPNGAGKSTVLRVISGLLRPRTGSVTLDGRELTGCSPAAVIGAGIVQVPQQGGLFGDLTVRENMLVGGHVIRRDKARLKRRIAELTEAFPILGERAGEKAANLSGGQRRIVEFARCLITEPRGRAARRADARAGPARERDRVRDHADGAAAGRDRADGRAERALRAQAGRSRRGHGARAGAAQRQLGRAARAAGHVGAVLRLERGQSVT